MSVVPPRQVAVLSIYNEEEIVKATGPSVMEACMTELRAFAVSCGVDPGHMRALHHNTLLLRLDELPREEFLAVIKHMAEDVSEMTVPGAPELGMGVRVGAMSERALRSFVNDAATDLIAHMNHVDCRAAFLTGDELDIWRELESTGIEFLSHEQLKYIDPFTGLLTERRFFALFDEILHQPQSFEEDLSVIYLDIDDFKSYNRSFDHEQGDLLLLFVAHQIQHEFPTDIVAHLSVDRFAVITSSPDVVRKCAAIHEATKAYRDTFAPEIKCGVYVIEEGVPTPHVALDCAKLACESIKGRYDMSCRFFDNEIRDRLFTRRYVAHHAEQAVNEHWIRAYAQPVVDTNSGELCGFEALARWDDPERGILSPAVFIPTLEDAHLIQTVDAFMVDEVCRHLSERIGRGERVTPASVNLSRLDFELCDIFATVVNSCKRWSIPHELLAIEITEGALDGNAALRTEMSRFREAGFEVWMDDFGCGYSSLNLLKDYEFDVLKVDMVFLRDMEENARSKTIVASVIEMAKSLGIRTLVEGVETPAQRDFLCEAGCDMMQGYLFGKPAPLGGAVF